MSTMRMMMMACCSVLFYSGRLLLLGPSTFRLKFLLDDMPVSLTHLSQCINHPVAALNNVLTLAGLDIRSLHLHTYVTYSTPAWPAKHRGASVAAGLLSPAELSILSYSKPIITRTSLIYS